MKILTKIHSAAQRVPRPKRTKIEQIASEVSAKITRHRPNMYRIGKVLRHLCEVRGLLPSMLQKKTHAEPDAQTEEPPVESDRSGYSLLDILKVGVLFGTGADVRVAIPTRSFHIASLHPSP